MGIFDNLRNQRQRPGGFGGRFSPQQLPQQNRFGGGLGGLFGGGGQGGFNPYQQQMPFMGGRFGGGMGGGMGGGFRGNPYGGGFGGGFNPYQGGGFNPYQGGRFGGGFGRPPMFGGGMGGFQGYDFNSPIGEAPPGATPTPPPSINDLFGGLDDEQRNAFFQQYGLSQTPPPSQIPVGGPVMPPRDEFISIGGAGGNDGMGEEGRIGTMGGPVYDDAGNLIGNLGSAGPTFPPGVLEPIVGIDPAEMDENTRRRIESGGGYIPNPQINMIPPTGGGFEIPGIDLERIRESLAKIEPIIPGISLPQPQPVPVRPRMPMPVPEIDPSLYSDPFLGGEMGGPMPMPKGVSPPKMMGPAPRIISDPIMPRPGKMMPQPVPVNPFDNPLFSDPGLGGEGGGRNVPMPKMIPMPQPVPKMIMPGPRVIVDPVMPRPVKKGIGSIGRPRNIKMNRR